MELVVLLEFHLTLLMLPLNPQVAAVAVVAVEVVVLLVKIITGVMEIQVAAVNMEVLQEEPALGQVTTVIPTHQELLG
jgi:hypothetical protein